MRKERLSLIIVLLVFGIGIGWFLNGLTPEKESPLPIQAFDEVVEDYSYYEPAFKRDGQVFRGQPLSEDLTGDGQPELIFITVGEGCASCHAKNLYIFQDEKELLKLESNDPFFHALPRRGFLIVEPVSDTYEASCCPTSFQNAVYLWDGQTFKQR